MSEFVLEVGVEEVPAGFLPSIREQIQRGFTGKLAAAGLPCARIEVHQTLRRLVVHLAGLAERQADRTEEVLGPPRAAAVDASGAFTKAALGFARSRGVAIDECRIVTTPKGEYLGFTRRIDGAETAAVLPGICTEVLSGLSFPKSMRWGEGIFVFVRPVRWILAVLNGGPLPFEFVGVRAGACTRLDRFRAPADQSVVGWEAYLTALHGAGIVLDADERRARLRAKLEEEAVAAGGHIRPDPELLDVVADLVETPLVVRGRFAEEFLELPQEILMTSMREHQKQFSVLDASGRQLPCFLAIADAACDPSGNIRHGNERVLRARLEDARFFWNDDARAKLEDRAGRLDRVLFQQGLGTYADKCVRLAGLVKRLRAMAGLDAVLDDASAKAASLCKADLTTDMVKEFTSLQGVVGGLYARREGHSEKIWRAIYEHYQPVSADDPVPATDEGCLLSLADRLDTIAGCFAIGRIPSGSRDPLGLRRIGQGAVRICIEKGWSLALRDAMAAALDGYGQTVRTGRSREQILADLSEFLDARLHFAFDERFGSDLVGSVIDLPQKDPTDLERRLQALNTFIAAGDFLSLATAFKRIRNILREQPLCAVSEGAFRQDEERTLWRNFVLVKTEAEPMVSDGRYEPALAAIATLRAPVDRFFDKVLVMDGDSVLRANRLGLLQELAAFLLRVADISQIAVEERLRARAAAGGVPA